MQHSVNLVDTRRSPIVLPIAGLHMRPHRESVEITEDCKRVIGVQPQVPGGADGGPPLRSTVAAAEGHESMTLPLAEWKRRGETHSSSRSATERSEKRALVPQSEQPPPCMRTPTPSVSGNTLHKALGSSHLHYELVFHVMYNSESGSQSRRRRARREMRAGMSHHSTTHPPRFPTPPCSSPPQIVRIVTDTDSTTPPHSSTAHVSVRDQ